MELRCLNCQGSVGDSPKLFQSVFVCAECHGKCEQFHKQSLADIHGLLLALSMIGDKLLAGGLELPTTASGRIELLLRWMQESQLKCLNTPSTPATSPQMRFYSSITKPPAPSADGSSGSPSSTG